MEGGGANWEMPSVQISTKEEYGDIHEQIDPKDVSRVSVL